MKVNAYGWEITYEGFPSEPEKLVVEPENMEFFAFFARSGTDIAYGRDYPGVYPLFKKGKEFSFLPKPGFVEVEPGSALTPIGFRRWAYFSFPPNLESFELFLRAAVSIDGALGFSSFLDSSIILALNPSLHAYSVVRENSLLEKRVKAVAEMLGAEVEIIYINEEEVAKSYEKVKSYAKTEEELAELIVLNILARNVKEKTVLLGTGADEIFADFNLSELRRLCKIDFIALYLEKKLIYPPYLKREVFSFARGLPREKRIRKIFLRELASRLKLPKDVVEAPVVRVHKSTEVKEIIARIRASEASS